MKLDIYHMHNLDCDVGKPGCNRHVNSSF